MTGRDDARGLGEDAPDSGEDARVRGEDARGSEEKMRAGQATPAHQRAVTLAPPATVHPTRVHHWRTLAHAALSRLARGLAAAVLTCLPVGVLAVIVTLEWDPLIRLDHELIVAATDITRAHEGLRTALIAWQQAFLPQHVYLLALIAVIWVWRSGLRVHALWGVGTMLIGWNLGLQVKLIVERARPVYDDPVSSAPGFSYPSGHAFNAAMAVCTVLVMAWPLLARRPRSVRVAAVCGGAAFAILTALDRVFLGVHFPSDVTAGVLLAVGLTAASYAGFRHTPHSHKD